MSLVTIVHNAANTLGRVFIRRKCKVEQIFVDNVSAIKASNGVFANATAHQWGPLIVCEEYTECFIVIMNANTTVGGTIPTLTMSIQAWDRKNLLWTPWTLPATPIAIPTAGVGAAPSGLATLQLSNLGFAFRVGFTCLNTATNDGTVYATATFKT